MGELAVDMFVTIDGVAQSPGSPDEDREAGFPYGGWQAPFLDPESGEYITKEIERNEALVLGRKTYDIFSSYWPNAPAGPISNKLNAMPKYVASRTRKDVPWRNSQLIRDDVAKEVPRIKQKHREVHVIGSLDLVQTLLKHELVDRLNLWVYPIVLGKGKRLFADGTVPTAFRLTTSRAFPKGAVLLSYARGGKPIFGDMSQEAAAAKA